MKIPMLLLVLFLPPLSSSRAKIWLVDNTGNPNADFTTLAGAFESSSVQNGDTLHLTGSAAPYSNGDLTLTKRLVILGPGYFLSENVAQANLNPALLNGTLYLGSGASGSVIMGLSMFNGGGVCIQVHQSISNIVIRRCKLAGGNPAIRVNSLTGATVAVNGLIIAQNYLTSNSSPIFIEVNSGANILIENNYLLIGSFQQSQNANAIRSSETSSLTIRHNVFQGGISVHNAVIENNIQASTNTISTTNSVVRNNLSQGTGLPSGNGNQNSVNMQAVFLNQGSTDGRWQLQSGSPAIGAGFNGVNCGMFGGSEPYILSGVPSIPRIIEFNAPKTGSSQSGLPIQLRVKAQN